MKDWRGFCFVLHQNVGRKRSDLKLRLLDIGGWRVFGVGERGNEGQGENIFGWAPALGIIDPGERGLEDFFPQDKQCYGGQAAN